MRQILSIFVFICWVLLSNIYSADDSDFTDIIETDTGFKTSFINIGQGNASVVIDNTTGKRIFIDSGSSQHPIHPQTKIKGVAWDNLREHMEFIPCALENQPVIFVCSHPDKDHLNLFSNFISLVKDHLTKNPNISFYLGGPFEKYLCSSDSLNFFNSIFILPSPQIFSVSHALSAHEMQVLHIETESKRLILGVADGHEGIKEALTREIKLGIQEKVRPFILRSKLVGFSDPDGRIMTEILCANAGHSSKRNYASSNFFETELPSGEEEIINHDENVNSIIMRLIFYGSFSIIMTGDATGITTDRLVKHFYVEGSNYNSLACTASIACHHGAITEESNNKEWGLITQPQYVIFSAGKYEKYHHPQFDALLNYSLSPRIIKDYQEHSILCARNKDSNAIREIIDHTYAFISSRKKLTSTDFWHEIKTQYALFSTHSSGTIVFHIGVGGVLKPLELVWSK